MASRREHRDGARVALARLCVELPGEEPSELPGTMVGGNISTGGVGFVLDGESPEVAVGDRVTVRFSLPDSFDELVVRAEVRHLSPREAGGYRVGARFLDADELVQNPLYRYVEEALLAVRATSESFIDI